MTESFGFSLLDIKISILLVLVFVGGILVGYDIRNHKNKRKIIQAAGGDE